MEGGLVRPPRRNTMFLKLRIIFTILSAIFAAAVLPVGAWLGWIPAIACAAVAGICFFVMLFFKQEQLKREPEATQTEESSEKTSESKEEKK